MITLQFNNETIQLLLKVIDDTATRSEVIKFYSFIQQQLYQIDLNAKKDAEAKEELAMKQKLAQLMKERDELLATNKDSSSDEAKDESKMLE